jgi:hypothetical protein
MLTTDFRGAFGATDHFENHLSFELRANLATLAHVRAPLGQL